MASSSEDGARWLLKALHPAEPSISAVRLPDGSAMDTVAVETCLTHTLSPVAAASQPWGAQMTLLPHPTCLLEIYPTDGASADIPYTLRNTLFATVLTGTYPADTDIANLMTVAEEWRLTSMSVTIHLDANATKDSGTIVAAHVPVKPNLLNYSVTTGAGTVLGAYPAVWFDADATGKGADAPTYDQLLQMPRAYQSNLRTGLYMPLKLSNTSQHWHSRREVCKLTLGSQWSGLTTINSGNCPYLNNTTKVPTWPNWDVTPATRQVSDSNLGGGLMSGFLGDNFGRIIVKNVDPSSAVVIKIKCGLELKVQPTSPQAVHLQKAPALDPVAIGSYFQIIRQLPDAYPADYNDGGKILGLISKAIKFLQPVLPFVPGVGGLLSTAAGPVASLVDYGAKQLANPQRKNKKNQRRPVPIPQEVLQELAKPKVVRTMRKQVVANNAKGQRKRT